MIAYCTTLASVKLIGMKNDNGKIKLYLSRSTYPVNSSIVGTVNVPAGLNVASLKMYVAGRSRLDPRWHDVPSITKLYGTHPCHDELPKWLEKMAEDSCFGFGPSSGGKPSVANKNGGGDARSICFWSTNVLTLWDNTNGTGMKVPMVDGHDGEDGNSMRYEENGNPRPLKMHGSDWFKESSYFIEMMQELSNEGDMALDYGEDSSNSDSSESDSESDDDLSESSDDGNYSHAGSSNVSEEQEGEEINEGDEDIPQERVDDASRHTNMEGEPMNFTFKVDLPTDIPPTVNAVCARYFYSTVVFAQTKDGKSIVMQAPFNVVASDKDKFLHARTKGDSRGNKTAISIGSIYALAHKRPYLLPLSTTYKAEPWSISVKRSQNIWDPSFNDTMKTIPIGEGEYKCGTLCIVGGGIMSPGERISLQFFFENDSENATAILPCYQVSACLQGAEYAIDIHGKKTKTRSYVFSTDHERIYPGTTEGASLNLSLPLHCPITIATDFCEIAVTCRIDLTVRTPQMGTDNNNSFRFLTVEFPCRVIQCAPEDEPMENCLSSDLENKLLDMKWSSSAVTDKDSKSSSDNDANKNIICRKIISSQVLNDLNMLSLHVQNRI